MISADSLVFGLVGIAAENDGRGLPELESLMYDYASVLHNDGDSERAGYVRGLADYVSRVADAYASTALR